MNDSIDELLLDIFRSRGIWNVSGPLGRRVQAFQARYILAEVEVPREDIDRFIKDVYETNLPRLRKNLPGIANRCYDYLNKKGAFRVD